MTAKKVSTAARTAPAPSLVTLPESETTVERMVRQAQQAIAQRAYFLFQERGYAHATTSMIGFVPRRNYSGQCQSRYRAMTTR